MEIEPSYDPDGSLAAWLCWRGEKLLGSVCRTKPSRWHVNDSDGAVVAITRTKRAAIDVLSVRSSGGNDG
jgi:hypothetical protein